jgi:hypothetical protein
MKLIFCLAMMVGTAHCVYSRTTDSNKIVVYSIPLPHVGEGMEYRFPSVVMKKISALMCRQPSNFIIRLDQYGDTTRMHITEFSMSVKLISDTSWKALFGATNRFLSFQGEKIPIYFKSDFRFSFVNWDVNDGENLDFVSEHWSDNVSSKVIFSTW